MSYTPTKGSPRPTVPGADPVEIVLTAAENLLAKIPVDSPFITEAQTVLAAAQAAVSVIDPSGMKALERTNILKAAEAKAMSGDATTIQQGIDEATAFAQDVPAHPTRWVRWARWICVQVGDADPLPTGA